MNRRVWFESESHQEGRKNHRDGAINKFLHTFTACFLACKRALFLRLKK